MSRIFRVQDDWIVLALWKSGKVEDFKRLLFQTSLVLMMAEGGKAVNPGALDACDVCNERPARDMKRLSSSSLVCGSCLQNWLAATEADIEEVREQGRISSQNIDQGFDELERLSREERDKALLEVDRMVWQQLDYFEKQKMTVQMALQRHATALDIAEKILSPKCSDTEVLLASSLARDGLASARDMLDDFSSLDVPPQIHTKVTSIAKVEEGLARAYTETEMRPRPDGGNTVFVIPQCIDVGKEAVLTAKLFDAMKCPLAAEMPVRFECYVTSPSGGRTYITTWREQSRTGHLDYRIPVTLATAGDYTLCAIVNMISKSVQLAVGKYFRFDQEHCPPSIGLTPNARVAERLKSAGEGQKVAKVLGAFSFSEGSHTWSLKLKPKTSGGKGMYFGITSQPSDTLVTSLAGSPSTLREGSASSPSTLREGSTSSPGEANSATPQDDAGSVVWRLDGEAYVSGRNVPLAKMSKWKKGDVLELRLCFQIRSVSYRPPHSCWLTCVNLRSKDENRMGVPLMSSTWRAAVWMTDVGSRAEILSYSGDAAPAKVSSP